MNSKHLLVKFLSLLTLTIIPQQLSAQNDSIRKVQVTQIAIVDADKVQNEVMDMDEYEVGSKIKKKIMKLFLFLFLIILSSFNIVIKAQTY